MLYVITFEMRRIYTKQLTIVLWLGQPVLSDNLQLRTGGFCCVGLVMLQYPLFPAYSRSSILRSHHEETRKLPGERDNARNNARCTQARKTTHGLDGQHQDVDRTPRRRVSQNDRTGINGESTSMVWPTIGSRTAKEQNRILTHML